MANKLYRDKVSVDTLRELLDYDPETGILTWKRRNRKHFSTHNAWATWNSRYAGKQAGAVHKSKNRRYRNLAIFDYKFLAHRVCWAIYYGEWPDEQIDHFDDNGLNNRISNLRLAPQIINMKNTKRRTDNTSGHVGVCWDSRRDKWYARIHLHGHNKHLGYFDDFEDAVQARISAQQEAEGFTTRHGNQS